jgi:hypothetical protein
MWFMLRKRESGIWKRDGEGTENRKTVGRVDANGESIWSGTAELLDHAVVQIY